MTRALSGTSERASMPGEFPETALVLPSGFGKTVPADLSKSGRPGASLFGLLGPMDPERSLLDFSKVHWGEVIAAVAAVLALVFVALFAMWVVGA